MRRLVLLLMLHGCFFKPDRPGDTKDASTNVDAGAPPSCPGRIFDPSPIGIATFPAVVEVLSPFERSDRLELWVVMYDDVDMKYHLHVATRTNATGYQALLAAPFTSSTHEDTQPTLTADGLHLFYASRDSNGARIWEAIRASPKDPFDTSAIAPGLENVDADAVTALPDGETVYFANPATSDFVSATRDQAGTFRLDLRVLGNGFSDAAIAPDGLELFEVPSGTSDIYQATRNAPPDAFVAVRQLTVYGRPGISADSKRLYYATGNSVLALTRGCP